MANPLGVDGFKKAAFAHTAALRFMQKPMLIKIFDRNIAISTKLLIPYYIFLIQKDCFLLYTNVYVMKLM